MALCLCGCGMNTEPCIINNKRLGYAKGQPNKYVKGHNRPWLGKKRPPISDEQKQKMRYAHLGQKYKVSDEGKAASTAGVVKALKGKKLSREHVQKVMKRRPITSLENKFLGIIEKHNLPYKFVGNGKFIIDGLNPDFININGDKIAIEVFSRFYKEIDGGSVEKYISDRIKRLSPFGWKIYFFDETQVYPEHVLGVLGGTP